MKQHRFNFLSRGWSKFLLSLVVLNTSSFALDTVSAQDYSKYYTDLPVPIKQVEAVKVPDTRVSITDFGGVGDGTALNTEAFRKAISALVKKGGGHLDVPAGTWKTGPIVLKSNIDLHIAKDATILFSEDKSLYVKDGEKKCVPFIKASKAENICITGEGVIDGQGDYWRPVKKVKVSADEWASYVAMGGVQKNGMWFPFNLNNGIPNVADTPENQEKMRNHLINITDSRNVLLEGVTLKNSPKFHFVPTRCKNLIIDGVNIECHWYAQNGDAIDIGNTQTALVVNSTITCGDDGICMKGGVAEAGVKAGPNSDLLIQNNTVYRAHGGFVIGSEFSGGMVRIIVRQCRFEGTDTGLRFKSAAGRGGKCEDIYCYDIQMKDIRNEAIIFETGYADQGAVVSATAGDDKSSFFPDFCNVTINDVVVDGARTAMKINGLQEYPVHDIKLNRVKMQNCKFGLNLTNAANIIMKDVDINTKSQPIIYKTTCRNIQLNGKKLVK